MKKKIEKVFTLCIIFYFIISNPVAVFASEFDVEERSLRASNYIESYSTSVVAKGNGSLSITSKVQTLYLAELTIDVTLQVYTNGKWEDVSSWSSEGSGYYLYDISTYDGVVGKEYRSKAYVTAVVGKDSESKTIISKSITAY